MSTVTCALALARIESLQKLRDARQKIQDECFKGKPDKGHADQIKFLDGAITKTKLVAAQVCIPIDQ
ncbi:hypothetical protein [Methylobacterium ajmalii]|uniref:hypothetical protein n=1 Tax=Methylobacterium ajmalii TaxID=2738439 RepID=UPI000B890FF3|nr:hypothetical protein [Methylobacterium ajmalii]MBK3396930.1 hypothetical protein [Methylobacterium ajmalii]MBK3410744.1 hypothetical protein [Methylobacterium ajmalii]MBK3426604.1 hypothetical protein [Methylobacterium ajmalii]MBZ6417195.1 hypothetical protein [Methylobacterium sp.]